MALKAVHRLVSFNGRIYILTRGKISRLALVNHLMEAIKIKYHFFYLKCSNNHLILFTGWGVHVGDNEYVGWMT